MAIEGVCAHQDCIGWCYQRTHVIHGHEKLFTTVEQYGTLYTMDGRRYPDQVPQDILDRVHVPKKFLHLVPTVQEEAPPAEVDFDLMAELESLGEDIEETHEVVQLARGIKQRQPKPDRSPVKIGR